MRALFLLAVGLCACSFEARPGSAPISCATSAECPAPLACLKGLCGTRSDDVTPPELVGTATVTPSLARAGEVITVTLEANEPLAGPPLVLLVFENGVSAPFAADETGRQFRLQVNGTEPQSRGRVQVELTDLAGNTKTYPDVGAVRLDFDAPRPGLATVALEVPTTSLIPTVEAVGPTGAALLAFSLDEAPASLQLSTTPNVFTFDAVDSGTSLLTFRATLRPSAQGSGAVQVQLDVTDAVGNRRAEPLVLSRELAFDVDAPTVNAAALLLERAPWGTSTNPLRAQRVVGAAEPLLLVRAVDDNGTVELGRTRVNLDGGFELTLSPPDRNDVRVELIDAAANVSPRVKVAESAVTLIAPLTPRGDAPRLLDTHSASARLSRLDAPPLPGRMAATTHSAGSFSAIANGEPTSGACDDMALAYSESEATVVGFGGSYPGGISNDEYLFNGERWARLSTTSRPPAMRGMLAYDRTRDTLVLLGDSSGRVWERTDGVWASKLITGPAGPRRNAGWVWTPHGVLLVGGTLVSGAPTSDVWRWTGEQWLTVDAGALPLGQVLGASTPQGQALFLVSADGGSPLTYASDGLSFWRVDAGTVPTNFGQLTFDPVAREWLANLDAPGGSTATLFALRDAGWAARGAGLANAFGQGAFDERRNVWTMGWCYHQERVWSRDGGARRAPFVDDMSPPRFAASTVTLPDGGWLVLGGNSWDPNANHTMFQLSQNPTRFEPQRTTPLSHPMVGYSAALLTPSGVLLAGGYFDKQGQPTNVVTRTFFLRLDGGVSDGVPLPVPIAGHSLTPTSRGAVLVGSSLGAITLETNNGAGWTRLDGGISLAHHVAIQAPDDPADVILMGGNSQFFTDFTTEAQRAVLRLSRVGTNVSVTTIGTLTGGRRQAAGTWDPKRRAAFLWGGNSLGQLDTLERVDFDGGFATAQLVNVVDVEGDGAPKPRDSASLFYTDDRLVLAMGQAGGDIPYEPWQYKESGQRAALQFEASLLSLALTGAQRVTLTIDATVSGTGGAQLSVWRNRGWRVIASTASTTPTPVHVELTDVAIDELGPRQLLALTATSIGVHDVLPASVTLSDVQVRVRFVRP